MTKTLHEQIDTAYPPGVTLLRSLRGHQFTVRTLSWTQDGSNIVSASEDGTVKLWDFESGEAVLTLQYGSFPIFSASPSSKGGIVACGSYDGSVTVWRVSDGSIVRILKGHSDWVVDVSCHRNGLMIAGRSYNGKVNVWDVSSGDLIRSQRSEGGTADTILFSPRGSSLAFCDRDNVIKICGAKSGRVVRALRGHNDDVSSIAFSPDGQRLVSASHDGTLRVWDTKTGRTILILEGHAGKVKGVVFSACSRLIASRGSDANQSIRVWCASSGQCLTTIPSPADRLISGLVFHPKLPLLATVGSEVQPNGMKRDLLIHLWALEVETLLENVKELAVKYTSAKVVLIGESNVGKSYLAHRLAKGEPPTDGSIQSTHGMSFWRLNPESLIPSVLNPEGHRRDIVVWDMGGQEEYRLIHQLFLQDTTVALVLLDPSRGQTAFKEIETWDKYLDKQLQNGDVTKILVGSKLDRESDTIDRKQLKRLVSGGKFEGFYETSAVTGRGIDALSEAIARAINWDALGTTSRPVLFQRIRDEISERRERGEVVLYLSDLYRAISSDVSVVEEQNAIAAVTGQLSAQGVIVESRALSGEPVLVLQVHEIERYAGSLIIAARDNPRGVPALELQAMARAEFIFPGINVNARLPRVQELAVLEATIDLMLEHGLCFVHQGLLIFPSLFGRDNGISDAEFRHTVSLYYDFAGAIDNIYASLVAWLVLAQDFGGLRLWADRVEFDINERGLCGLRKISRPGGFAHLDLYFGGNISRERRDLFISFVEEHLKQNGVEIHEHIAITCSCGEAIDEDIVRKRIARGEGDVACAVCDMRHKLASGAAGARELDPEIDKKTWALKTQIDDRRHRNSEMVIRTIAKSASTPVKIRPLRLLHLSDLHFNSDTPVPARLQWLLNDLKQPHGLAFDELDYLVISGDFTNRGNVPGFERAYEFVSDLTSRLGLTAERCIFAPGNHDVVDLLDAYVRRPDAKGLRDGEWIQEGRLVLGRNPDKYPLRFKPFSDRFYHKFKLQEYPLNYASQGVSIPFWDTGIQFLVFNTCWAIDEFHRRRAGVHPEAVAHALRQAQQQELEARATGRIGVDQPLIRIGVWHHAVVGRWQMDDAEFLGNLQQNQVKIGLHGDVHEMRRDLVRPWSNQGGMHVIGAGSFGANMADRPESVPRLYNVIEIQRDLRSIRVHTREQRLPDGPWDGWHEWTDPTTGLGRVPFYDIVL